MKLFRSTKSVLLLALLVVSGASACSPKDPGRATGGTTSESTAPEATQSSSPSSSLPDLDIGKFKSSPCDLIKADQLATLGTFKAPETDAKPLGPGCVWRPQNVTQGTQYTLTLVTNGSTIESMTKTAKDDPVFKEIKVEGRPAISSDGTNGRGDCGTAVGTSGKDAILVQLNTENEASPDFQDSCAATEKAAAFVIQNLKG
jgi:hypothetical protein